MHAACDLLDRQELDWDSVADYGGYVTSYQRFLEDYEPDYFLTEEEMFFEDPEPYAGKIDRGWRIPDGRWLGKHTLNGERIKEGGELRFGMSLILDIKTPTNVYPSYWIQMAGYEQLAWQRDGNVPLPGSVGRAILQLKKDGSSPTLHIRTEDQKSMDRFNAAKTLWYTKKEFFHSKETS